MSIFQSPVNQDADGNGLINSYYKPRSGSFHDGIDYRAAIGTGVLAASGGTIIRAGGVGVSPSAEFGNVIVIYHGIKNGKHTYSLYAHLSGFSQARDENGDLILENGQPREWRAGDQVYANQLIGLSGDTGPSGTPPHLHFEILQSDTEIEFDPSGAIGFDTHPYAINPLQFVYGDGVDITHTLNTADDTNQDFATVWGDIGNDVLVTPGPTTGLDALGRSVKFTAANLSGKSGNDHLIGNINNDKLRGGSGNDALVGGAGSDTLWGWEEAADTAVVLVRIRETADDGGNDTLVGGVNTLEDDNAQDKMYGGNGFDTYHVGNGDEIQDTDGNGRVFYKGSQLAIGLHTGEQDANQYISADNRFTYLVAGNDLIVTVNGAEPPVSFTIKNYSTGNLGIELRDMPSTGETFTLSQGMDGLLLDDQGVQSVAIVFAQGGNDLVQGTLNHDWIEGGLGHDMLTGNIGNDVVIGGLGNDFMSGWHGDDILIAGELDEDSPDNNLMFGEEGNDYLFGASGIDWIYGDTYGPRQAINTETGYQSWLGGGFPPNSSALLYDWSQSIVSWVGSALYKDPLDIYAGDDFIDAGAGDDIAFGGSGDDTMFGGEDNDTLQGEAGNDFVYGGTGDDYLYGDFWAYSRELDNIVIGEDVFGPYIQREHRNPVDYAGQDLLDGGAGRDVLQGGYGDDVYAYNQGYGVDIVYDSAGAFDRVILGPGITEQNVSLIASDSSLIVQVSGADGLLLQNWFNPDNRIERIEFANEIFWDYDTILDKLGLTEGEASGMGDNIPIANVAIGDDEADSIGGTDDNDAIYLFAGDDSVSTGGGDDRVNPGTGNDYVRDTSGDERYTMSLDWGHDAIEDLEGVDEVVFASGVDPESISFQRSGDDLRLHGADGNWIIFRDWFGDENARIERISFADGTVWEGATLNDLTQLITGTSGNNVLTGHDSSDDVIAGLGGNDVLSGLGGNDQLEGGMGDDELHGGAGDDVLIGGAGNDVYVLGTGMDILQGETSGTEVNTVRLSPGVTVDDVGAEYDGDNLVLNWGNGNGVTIENYVPNSSAWQFQLASGAPVAVAAFFADPVEAGGGSSGDAGFVNAVLDRYEQSRYQQLVDFWNPENGPGVFAASASIAVLDSQGNLVTDFGEFQPVEYPNGDINDPQAGGYYFPEGYGTFGNYSWAYTGSPISTLARDFVEVVRTDDVVGTQAASVTSFSLQDAQLVLSPFSLESGSRNVVGVILDSDIEAGLEDIGSGLTGSAPVMERTHFLRIFELGAGNDEAHLGTNAAASLVDGGSGDDSIKSGAYADLLYGGDGDDYLNSSSGDDILLGGDGADQLEGSLYNDVMMGMEGDDALYDAHNRNIFQGGEGNDTLDAGGLDHYYVPDPDPNSEFGLPTQFGSLLDGGTGHDRIWDSRASDLIAGGHDDDLITLTAGEDVIAFNRGDGHDQVRAQVSDLNKTLSLGGGIELQDIQLQRVDNDLVMHTGEGEFIVFSAWYELSNPPVSYLQIITTPEALPPLIEQYDFSAIVDDFDQAGNNDPWAIAISAGDAVIGTSSNAALGGNLAFQYAVDGHFAGMEADNVWTTMADEDFGRVNQGLSGGSNTVNSASGWIELQGSGTTVLPANEAPVVDRPIDNQEITVGQSFEFIVPHDSFFDADIADYFSSYSARLVGGAVLPSWLSFNPATRTFSGTPAIGQVGTLNIEVIVTDGAAQTASAQFSLEVGVLTGTEGDDFIEGGEGSEPIAGLGGNDFIFGNEGNDVISGDEGNDDLSGGEGNDTLYGGLGDDSLAGQSGNDTLDGGSGNDTLDGYDGDDLLLGGTGDTTYVYVIPGNGGTDDDSGNDNIYDVGGADSLNIFRESSELEFDLDQVGNDLIFTFSATNSITIQDWFSSSNYRIETISYKNEWNEQQSVSFTVNDIADLLLAGGFYNIEGTSGNNTLNGTFVAEQLTGLEGNDQINGLGGNDNIWGGDGDDALYGGAGNDHIAGGDGEDYSEGGTGNDHLIDLYGADDTYYYTVYGDGSGGSDLIGDIGGSDTLHIKLPSSITSFQVVRPGGGANLELRFAPGESVTLAQWFGSSAWRIEHIVVEQHDNSTVDYSPAQINAILTGANPPLVENPISDRTANENTAFQFQLPADTFIDPNNEALTLSATLADGSPLPSWLSFNAQTRSFSGTPDDGDLGNLQVKVTATDPGSLSVFDVFTLTVASVNDAPVVANVISGQMAEQGVAFSFTVPANTFIDEDAGDTLTLSAAQVNGSALPSWLSFNAQTGAFSGTPQPGDVMPLQIRVTATDGSAASVYSDIRLGFVGVTLPGTSGNDSLIGGDGDDQITGGAGNDVLQGNNGNDQIFGDEGNDSLSGNAGDDVIHGSAGGDSLDGGAGADQLDGGADSDYAYYSNSTEGVQVDLAAGTGVGGHAAGDILLNIEHVWGSAWDDTLTGDSSANFLLGGSGSDILSGGDGSDGLYGGADSDQIYGGVGNDTLSGESGADQIDGGAGTDYASYASSVSGVQVDLASGVGIGGEAAGDTLINIENLVGSSSNDTLSGDANVNSLLGGAGNDALSGRGGNDSLYGDAGDDFIQGGDGDDSLNGNAGNDVIDGGMGNDSLYGGTEDDQLSGGAGNDTLRGEAGSDLLDGGDGSDTLYGGSGMDQLDGGEGTDYANYSLSTSAVQVSLANGTGLGGDAEGDILLNIENLTGSALNDALYGDAFINSLFGGSGNDTLSGLGGNDSLSGDAGDDLVQGGDGNDTLNGNAGADLIQGNDGDDLLRGDAGNDVMDGGIGNDSLYGGTEDDELSGGAGDDDLYGEAGVDVLDGGAGEDYLRGEAGVDVLGGGDDNDSLYGGADADQLDGGGGIDYARYSSSTAGVQVDLAAGTGTGGDAAGDTLVNIENVSGSSLNDTLSGNASANTLSGEAGNDAVSGAGGDDVLYGDAGDDLVQGGDGNDLLNGGAGNDVMDGGMGNDSLYGGTENDELSGGAGDDYLYGEAGVDVLGGSDGNDSLYGGAGADALDGGAGIDYARYSSSTAGVQVDLIAGTGTGGDAAGDTLFNIENVSGSSLNDTLSGNASANSLHGGSGNDTVSGAGGNDFLQGDDGDDLVQGGDGDDTLYGNAGSDTIEGGNGNDGINGGMGDDELSGGAGNDNIYGEAGVDVLSGGDGDDSLYGGAGADELDGGAGIDYARYSTSTAAVQVDLVAGTGTGSDAAGDTLVNIENVSGSSLNDTLSGNASANTLSGEAGDDTISGAGGDDSLYGDAGADQLSGGDGNDTLYGNTDNDTLSGGASNDGLRGGAGSDLYQFGIGGDHDDITEDEGGTIDTGSTDRVVFGAGIDTDDLWFTQEGNDLRIWVEGTDDWLQINNWYSNSAPGIEQFETDAGDILLASEVHQLVDAMAVFDPPSSGVLNVPQSAQDDVASVITANWS